MMTTLTVTLCFTAVLAAYSVLGADSGHGNGLVKMKSGGQFTINCNITDSKKKTFSLFARLPSKNIVMVYDNQINHFIISNKYKERVTISGTMHKLTMKITDLQVSDSGLYVGQYSKFNLEKNVEEVEEGCSVLLFVNSEDKSAVKGSSAMPEPLVLVFAMTICTILVVCFQ